MVESHGLVRIIGQNLKDGVLGSGATLGFRFLGRCDVLLCFAIACDHRRACAPHRFGRQADELQRLAKALFGTCGTYPAALDLDLAVDDDIRQGGKRARNALEAAVELGTRRSGAVEDGVLPLSLVSGYGHHRDLLALRHGRKCILPGTHGLLIACLRACRVFVLERGVPVRPRVHELREHLERDRARRGRAHVRGHTLAHEVANAYKVVGEVVLQAVVQRRKLAGKARRIHAEVLGIHGAQLHDLLLELWVGSGRESLRVRVEDPVRKGDLA